MFRAVCFVCNILSLNIFSIYIILSISDKRVVCVESLVFTVQEISKCHVNSCPLLTFKKEVTLNS